VFDLLPCCRVPFHKFSLWPDIMTFVGGHGLQGHLFTGQSRVAPGARVCPVWLCLVSGGETRLPVVPGARPTFLGCRALKMSGKILSPCSLQVWLSRRQHLCSKLTLLLPAYCCVVCATAVLPHCCALLRLRLPLQAPTSAALWVNFFNFAKILNFSSYLSQIEYLSSLSHCSVTQFGLLQSL